MASTSPVEEMIDQEDWSHISEPALRKRIQNRNSQRKLRAKRKMQNQPISFDIMTSTSGLEIDLDNSGAPVADDFLFDGLIDPLNPLSPSLDLDLMTPPPLDVHSSSTLDFSALDTSSWTEAPNPEYLAVGTGGIDEGALILDPALVSDVSTPGPGVDTRIVGASTQSSNDIHIYIHHDCPSPLLSNTANQQPLPSLGPSAARRSRWGTRIFHLHSNNTNNNTNNAGRGESRCESSCSAARKKRRAAPAPPPPPPTAHFPGTCHNCGSLTGPGQPDSPYPSSHSHIAQVARILSHSHPALAEMLMQPNAHIEYGYPGFSSSSSSSSSSSFSAITPPADEMQKGKDAEAEAEAEVSEASEASDVRPLHIVINLPPSPAAYSD